MAKNNNLVHFLNDVAHSIQAVEGSTALIPAREFKDRIKQIINEEEEPTGLPDVYNYTFESTGTSSFHFIISVMLLADGNRRYTGLIDNSIEFTFNFDMPTSSSGIIDYKSDTFDLPQGIHTFTIFNPNKDAFFYDMHQFNEVYVFKTGEGLLPGYSTVVRNENGSYYGWTYDKTKIYNQSSTFNGNITITPAIKGGKYNMLCLDAEITAGRDGYYNLFYIVLKPTIPTAWNDASGFKTIYGSNCYTRTNYDGSTPWYLLKRQVIKIPLNDITQDFYIYMHKCECLINVYNIWLE